MLRCWKTLWETPLPQFVFQFLPVYPQMDWVLSESRMPGIWPMGPTMHIPPETNELFSNTHGLPAFAIEKKKKKKDPNTLTWFTSQTMETI